MFRAACCFIVVVFFGLEARDLNVAQSSIWSPTTTTSGCTASNPNKNNGYYNTLSNLHNASSSTAFGNPMALTPGELPGYTGWARPEWTLAGFFSIQQPPATTTTTVQPAPHFVTVMGESFSILVECQGHDDCSKASSLFYLRAYGPAVLPGRVVVVDAIQEMTRQKQTTQEDMVTGSRYEFQFRPMDSGVYTVEAVLTFSNPPPLDLFPLPAIYEQPVYEGYLLPGFPLQVVVLEAPATTATAPAFLEESSSPQPSSTEQRYCTRAELTETSSFSAVSKARWKVTSKPNGAGYTSKTLTRQKEQQQQQLQTISEDGYKQGIHSIGIQMAYTYYSPACDIVPKLAFLKRQGNNNPFYHCGKVVATTTTTTTTPSDSSSMSISTGGKTEQNIVVIFIGDSTMRIQHAMFEGYVNHLPNVQTAFIDLYHGYRWVQKQVENTIQAQLDEIQRRHPDALKVVLFNTGLHDIHRLCGQEWAKDRRDYLKNDALAAGTFRCTLEYKTLLDEFATLIQEFPAQLKVFQTTTAGWPKYGNYGVDWNHRGQAMPLAPDVVAQFNEIAVNVLLDSKYVNDIYIMDGYWITYARPDNREVGSIGQKLSHPGLEVQSAMTRVWATMILQEVCNFQDHY
jgi:hypothetical protein